MRASTVAARSRQLAPDGARQWMARRSSTPSTRSPSTSVTARAGAFLQPNALKGQKARTALIDADTGEVVVESGKKLTPRLLRQLSEKGLKAIKASDDDLYGNYLAEDLVNMQTGEIFLEAGDEIDEKTLGVILGAGFEEIPVLDIDHINVGAYIRKHARRRQEREPQDALFDIYRVMRPGEPPTMDFGRSHVQHAVLRSGALRSLRRRPREDEHASRPRRRRHRAHPAQGRHSGCRQDAGRAA